MEKEFNEYRYFRLSEMSPDEIKEKQHIWDDLMREPLPYWNKYGLRYSVDYLNSIFPHVVFLPVEYMARFVDLVTKTMVDTHNTEFQNNSLGNLDNPEHQSITEDNMEYWKSMFERGSATGVGNLAYTILHTKDFQTKERCDIALNLMFEYFIKCYMTQISN